MTDKVLATYEGQQEIAEAIRGINLEALTQKAVWVDSVADMRELDAPQGITVATRGYYSPNDGGNWFYVIRAKAAGDTDDGGSIIELENGNVAELITDGTVNVKQFGAKGDGVTNDVQAINSAFVFALNTCKRLVIPNGVYAVQTPVYFDTLHSMDYVLVSAYGASIKAVGTAWSKTDFVVEIGRRSDTVYYPQYLTIEGLCVDCNNLCSGINMKFVNYWVLRDVSVWSGFKGVEFSNTYYGRFAGMNSIRSCSCGILLMSPQINNIEFNQIGINTGNSTLHDKSYGVAIHSTALGAVKFNGLIIENHDYGIKRIGRQRETDAGVSGVYEINTCYFENISTAVIDLADTYQDNEIVPVDGTLTKFFYSFCNITISNCIVDGNCKFILPAGGSLKFINNQRFIVEKNPDLTTSYELTVFGDFVNTDMGYSVVTPRDNRVSFKLSPSIDNKLVHSAGGSTYPSNNELGLLSATDNFYVKTANPVFYIRNHIATEVNPHPITVLSESFVYRPVGYIMPDKTTNTYKMLQIDNDSVVVRKYYFNRMNSARNNTPLYGIMNHLSDYADRTSFPVIYDIYFRPTYQLKKYKDALIKDNNNEATDATYLTYKRAFKIQELLDGEATLVNGEYYYVYEIDAFLYYNNTTLIWFTDYFGVNSSSTSSNLRFFRTTAQVTGFDKATEDGYGLEVYLCYCTEDSKLYYRFREDSAYQEIAFFNT